MKKKLFTPHLIILILSFFVFSCSDSIEPIDSIVGENEEEVINEENSTDDSDDNSDDGNSNDDSNDDTSDDSDNTDDTSDDSSEDDTGNSDDSSGDDTGNNDDTSGDDTGGDDSMQATLVGNWRLVSATINNGQASTVFNGIPVSFPFTSTSQDEDVDITFQENPNIIQGMGQYTNVIEFTVLGNAFSEETTFDSPLTDGNWEMNNDELTISGSSQANGAFTITELTATSLILQTEFEETVPTADLELETTGVLVIELARN